MSVDDRKPGTYRRVLVVEDNIAMNTAICDILELHGYRVSSAQNGLDALSLLRDERPDVILCDIMMPKMDGHALLKETRGDSRWSTIPFIFLTARSTLDDRRQAKEVGIEDYLVKPVDPEDLLLAVNNALRRVEATAEETRRQLDTLRTQIVSTLQHEFRTPLTFILGYAEYLAEIADDETMPDGLRSSVEAILEGGYRLQDLIEKFLLLAELQNRISLPVPTSTVDFDTLLQTIVQQYREKASAAGLELAAQSMPTSRSVCGDPLYLQKALSRIVENAILYRRADSHAIWLSVVEDEEYLGVAVSDEGTGIPQDLLATLQNPFEQADREHRTVPGAGLSVALAHHVARIHGGRLEIESVEGEGSCFTLWLPRQTAVTA